LAQLAPGLGYVFPPAIPIGQASNVQLGGFDFTTDLQWFVHDEHVRLKVTGTPGDYHLPPPPYWIGPRASNESPPIPREVPAQLDVDADAPTGLVRWQVANANGCSGTAVFYVSHGTEIIESRSRDFPQRLATLPVAVSGRLARLTEVDRYEVVADRDGPISVELMARRLGANFNGMLQVRDSSGNLLADFADTQGLDGGLTFAARAGGIYTISVHDLDFRGDRAYVYRLSVEPGPRVICTIPASGQRGTSCDVEFIGMGVATGKPVMESLRQVVAFPTDPSLVSYSYRLETVYGPVNVDIPLSDLTQLTSGPIALLDGTSAMSVEAPGAVTGRFQADIDEQRFIWQAEKDEYWSLDLQSRAIGGRLDVALKLLGPDGIQIAENDDLPGTADAEIEFQAKVSGTHVCIVRNMSASVGAANDVYRLQLRRQSPDFSLEVPQKINVPLGGTAEVIVKAKRLGGFDHPVTVVVEGLPTGIVADGDWTIPKGQNELKAVLRSTADAAVVASAIRFFGTGQIGESVVTRPAMAAASGSLCPRSPADTQIPDVLVAMTMSPPFEVLVVDRERQREVPRGTTALTELDIVRKDQFTGEIQVEMSAQQSRIRQGMLGHTVRVPAETTRVLYPCFMPEWLGTDLTSRIVVHGVAAVPDPQGNLRHLTKPGDARITMILEGALLKVETDDQEHSVLSGESFDVPIRLSRSPKLPIATKVELVVPDEITGLLHANPLVMAPDQEEGVLRISSVADSRLLGLWQLRLTATSLQDEKWPVISETKVRVDFSVERRSE
jgi:hypothetical protein